MVFFYSASEARGADPGKDVEIMFAFGVNSLNLSLSPLFSMVCSLRDSISITERHLSLQSQHLSYGKKFTIWTNTSSFKTCLFELVALWPLGASSEPQPQALLVTIKRKSTVRVLQHVLYLREVEKTNLNCIWWATIVIENKEALLTLTPQVCDFFSGCNETLTGLNGTFYSPNYPNKYPNGQYCSWTITVSPAQQIHLTFTDFSLQNENNMDVLYVYDGKNVSGKVLGVFSGGHRPPKEGIYSSSNHMFLIFKSDMNISFTGFSVLYNATNCSSYSCVTVANQTTQTTKVTRSGNSGHLATPYSFPVTT